MLSDTRAGMTHPALDLERTLDYAIDGLVRMDVELLVQLAQISQEWEDCLDILSVSRDEHARLSWKLLLLNRLLRQTRVNLRILGLEPERCLPATGYAAALRQ